MKALILVDLQIDFLTGGTLAVPDEDITVYEVPLGEVHEWLKSKAGSGLLVDPKVYAGLYFIRRTL